MDNIFIGLGSNLGNKEENIIKAIDLIRKRFKILNVSSLYETEPIGYKQQDWFLNCAMKINTNLKPQELLIFLQSIEKKLGRIRTIKDGPRTIDLDILFYNNKIINENNLIVPHSRLHERLFVLEPLKEICPNFVHPVLKKSVEEIYSMADDTKIVKKLEASSKK